ncbi:MAG: alpha/beta fold hydrolase [Paludibacteraceae bacterium]|nr:alpha/beta fold hydrolase [Paludibacteraceae bacterium]
MKRLLLSCIVSLPALSCFAQQVQTWSGELSLGANKLNISFNIKTLADNQQVCTMDIPEQGAKDFPVQLVKNDADSLIIAMPALQANYKGHKTSAQSIKGTFTQVGYAFPLDLTSSKITLNRPQTPTPPFAYKTREVTFHSVKNNATLSGTLTYPVNYNEQNAPSTPVVLMVTGSGAQNRDEEVFDHKLFLVIADHLAKNGIASLRYDDRGFASSTGNIDGTTADNLADAQAGIEYLRSLKQFGKVGIIGHSEGGTIAFMLGANQSVDFLISLAGAAAQGIDILIGQNKAILPLQGVPEEMANDYATVLKVIFEDRIQGTKIDNPSQYVTGICESHKINLPLQLITNLEKSISFGGQWIDYFLAYDPTTAIRQITCPVMALNGTLDMQVLYQDNIPLIKLHLPQNNLHLVKEYEALNHFFQHCTPTTALNYGQIEETISPEVLSDLVTWIQTIK